MQFSRKRSKSDNASFEFQNLDDGDSENDGFINLAPESEEIGRKLSRTEERKKWWKVYALHFLFVWNTRGYEFASVCAYFLFTG